MNRLVTGARYSRRCLRFAFSKLVRDDDAGRCSLSLASQLRTRGDMVLLRTLAVGLLLASNGAAQDDSKLRIISIGAHPDDSEFYAGGTAAKWVRAGHAVKFVSLTNGDAGHQEQGGGALAARRRGETREVARRLGIEYDVLDNHDGELMPTLEVRQQVIRLIRQWNADLVLSPRPNDYHPDHRYAGVLVQDAAYMVTVPNLVTDAPALRRNPVFAYFSDNFTRPYPFQADIVVAIDDVIDLKFDVLDAHVSQVYEWLPWHLEILDQVPTDLVERRRWLQEELPRLDPDYVFEVPAGWRGSLRKWYGAKADDVRHAEAFEITEFGRQPAEEEIRELFPFFPE